MHTVMTHDCKHHLTHLSQELLGLPAECIRHFKEDSIGVTIPNQRRHVRWGIGVEDASELVMPARILTTNSAAAMSAALLEVAPELGIEGMNDVAKKVWSICIHHHGSSGDRICITGSLAISSVCINALINRSSFQPSLI